MMSDNITAFGIFFNIFFGFINGSIYDFSFRFNISDKIDESVYSLDREFRCIYSTKYGDYRQFCPVEKDKRNAKFVDDILDYFITNVNLPRTFPITLKNYSEQSVSPTFTLSDEQQFTLDDSQCNSLTPLQECQLNLTYAPSNDGTDVLTIGFVRRFNTGFITYFFSDTTAKTKFPAVITIRFTMKARLYI